MSLMKHLETVFLIIVTCNLNFQAIAQAPQKINYQAVVRDGSGNVISNSTIGMRISILQNSSSGMAVYQELCNPNPQTNAYGIVNIAIGTGSPQLGTFSGINWAGAEYYIKIEVDPAGGSNYTLTSVSQLLSVPYSFYSSESGASVPAHYIGELYGGGIVFYVDHTGNHGLICSVADMSASTTWSDNPTSLIGPAAQSLWDGQSNTDAIILQSTATSAADLCANYANANMGTGVFNDWYLPAIDQLNLLYQAKYQVNKTLDSDGNSVTISLVLDIYWSSTENSSISAWAYNFITAEIVGNDKLCTPVRIRAIREF